MQLFLLIIVIISYLYFIYFNIIFKMIVKISQKILNYKFIYYNIVK